MLRKVGDVLQYDFILKYGIVINELAENLGVHANRISEIIRGKRKVTIDTDLRLCKFFKLKKGYFLQLQIAYDTAVCEEEIAGELDAIVPCLK